MYSTCRCSIKCKKKFLLKELNARKPLCVAGFSIIFAVIVGLLQLLILLTAVCFFHTVFTDSVMCYFYLQHFYQHL